MTTAEPTRTASDETIALPLFVYGSLRDPSVRTSLLGDRPELTTRPATLPGYARLLVPGFGYPFIVPAAADRVDGEVILGLRTADYAVLDEYEDVSDALYARVQVELETPEGRCSAWAYVKGAASGQSAVGSRRRLGRLPCLRSAEEGLGEHACLIGCWPSTAPSSGSRSRARAPR